MKKRLMQHRSVLRSALQRGFTLIELLITVALSTLVGVLIYTVFINQTAAYRAQADMGAMQQNLRVAMEMVTRDVAGAGWAMGFDGGTWGAGGQGGIANSARYGLRIRDGFPVSSGSDAIEIIIMNPDRSNWSYTDPDTRHACDTTEITFASGWEGAAAQFTAAGAADQIMCFNPSSQMGRASSWLWDVAGPGDGAAGTVPVAVNTQTDYATNCTRALANEMICGPVTHVAYYLDKSSSDGIGIGSADLPVLYLVPDVGLAEADGGYPHSDDIPVALGIEDLQLKVCERGLGNDCEVESSWTFGYDLSSSTSWENLAAVRVMMTARTVRADNTRTVVSSPSDLDSTDVYTPSSAADGYHRRVARTEVAMRNAMAAWQAARAPY